MVETRRASNTFEMSPSNRAVADALRAGWSITNGPKLPNGPAYPKAQAATFYDLSSPELAEWMRGGRTSYGGARVSEHVALRNSTFFRATNLISSSIGMLPTFLMRKIEASDGSYTIEKARDHPLFKVFHKRPNAYQTAFEFKSYMQLLALLDGNAYALIVRGVGGKVVSLIPLKRFSITPQLSDSWQLTFLYERPNGAGSVTLNASDVFHFRHPITRDGLRGLSLIDIAADALGIASQAEQAAGKLLSGGVMAGGSLETSATLGPEAITSLKQSMDEQHSGPDSAGKWLILEEGLTAKPFVTNSKDAQFDELRQREMEEISRFSGVPRPLLMFDETSWGSGIEQLGIYFVTYCLMPWFVAWEQAIARSCLTQAEQDADELYVKFNEGALLRGSLKDQADFFKAALGPNQAYMSINEVRGNFDLNPKTGDETGPDAIPVPTSGPAVLPTEDPKT